MKRRHPTRALDQLSLPFRTRGGARRGAGRKPKGPRAGVSHAARPKLSRHHPVHVTTRLRGGLPSLRHPTEIAVLERAFRAGSERMGFRLVHYSIQRDHLHFLVEAEDERALGRGMKGLLVRVARVLNRLWRRVGAVLADRYHAHALRTPRETRNALVYVLNNAKKHVGRYSGLDPGSSARWFDGWTESASSPHHPPDTPRIVAEARTWLVRVGWRRHGRIDPSEVPRAREP